jgi:hypothetical protein
VLKLKRRMKEVVVQCLLEQSPRRETSRRWNMAKRNAPMYQGDRFGIDGKALHRASGMDDRPREKLSAAGHRKLIALAARAKMAPDRFLAEVISCQRTRHRTPR